jgi:hypothetical protein
MFPFQEGRGSIPVSSWDAVAVVTLFDVRVAAMSDDAHIVDTAEHVLAPRVLETAQAAGKTDFTARRWRTRIPLMQ